MSNYLSQEYKPRTFEPLFNTALADNVLGTLHGRYDANKAKIDQIQALYGSNLKGLRGVDNEYIASRLQEAQTVMDNYSRKNGNLAYNYVTDSLLSTLKSVTDDPIIRNAIISKSQYDSYNAEVERVKKEGKGGYNPINEKIGLKRGGFDKYMKGESKVLGSLDYQEYYDESKEFKDISENLDKYDNTIEKSWSDGRYIYTQKGNFLTENDLRNKVNSLLSDKAKVQMGINAEYLYDRGDSDEERLKNVKSAFEQYSTKSMASYDSYVNSMKLKVKNGEATQADLDKIIENKKYTKERFDKWMSEGNRESMYNTMYTEERIGDFASAFAFNNVSTTMSNDSSYLKAEEFAFNQRKEMFDQNIEMAKLDIEAQKLEVEKVKAGLPSSLSGGAGGIDGVGEKADPEYKPTESKTSDLDRFSKVIDDLGATTQAITAEIYEKQDAATQEMIRKRVEDSNGKLTTRDVISELSVGSYKNISEFDRKRLSDAITKEAVAKSKLNKAYADVEKEMDSSLYSKNVIDELISNDKVKIIWNNTKGGAGAFPLKDVLKASNALDTNGKLKGDINNHPKILEAIKKTMLADLVISESAKNNLSTDYTSLRKLAKLFGEDSKNVIVDNTSFGESLYFRPETKTGAFINAAKKNKTYNTDSGIWNLFPSSNSIQSLKKFNLGDVKNTDLYNEKVNSKLKETTFDVPKLITISNKSKVFNDLKSKVEDSNLVVNSEHSLYIAPIPNQPNLVKVYQNNKSAFTEIRIQDLPAALQSQYRFNTEFRFNVDNIPDISYKVKYLKNGNYSMKGMLDAYYGGDKGKINEVKLLTEEGATKALLSINPNLTGSYDKPTEVGKIVQNLVSSGTFDAKLVKGRDGEVYPTIYKNGREVYKSDKWHSRQEEIETAFDKVRFTNQEYVNAYLSDLIKNNDVTKLRELNGGK